MRSVDRYEDLLRAPLGRCFAGRQVLVWCPDSSLLGVSLWGSPGADDVALLVALLDFPHHPSLAGGCDVVFDARHLERLEGEVFDAYVAALQKRRAALAARVRRQALLRPAGMVGAVIAGAVPVTEAPAPWAVFTELAPALAWLQRADGDELAARLQQLLSPQVHGDPLLARLHAVLRGGGLRLTLDGAARRLGLGPRTLQRLLAARDTQFRTELGQARAAAAARLLAESDLRVEAIARRVGCCSGEHLATLLHRQHGTAPSALRQASRRRPGQGAV
jgi:AraC-like DNA-binding protein